MRAVGGSIGRLAMAEQRHLQQEEQGQQGQQERHEQQEEQVQ